MNSGQWCHWIESVAASTNPQVELPEETLSILVSQCRREPPPNGALILVFGSLSFCCDARASDIDVIVVDPNSESDHSYFALAFDQAIIDLNICSATWLRDSWKDRGWGYWISTSRIVSCSHDYSLEHTWMNAVNLYHSPNAVVSRWKEMKCDLDHLIAAATEAERNGWSALTRLYQHEVARLACLMICDRGSRRIYSKSTFVEDTRCAAASLGIEDLAMTILRHLSVGDSGFQGAQIDGFKSLRLCLSRFYRDSVELAKHGYTKAGHEKDRLAALSSIAFTPEAQYLDQTCMTSSFYHMLYAGPQPELFHAAIRAADSAAPVKRKAMSQRLANCSRPPEMSPVPGIRWVERRNDRVKIVLQTGGCRAGACSFCGLPAFGRMARYDDTIVLSAIRKTIVPQDRHVSVYNDGSFLDPREVSDYLCDGIVEHLKDCSVRRLDIESLPRFVLQRRHERILSIGSFEEVWLAMGLQTIGDWMAVERLGRPDCDALFVRAIEILRSVGIRTRIYLLYGFGTYGKAFWMNRLRESLDWCRHQSVSRVTVCEFSDPLTGSRNEAIPSAIEVMSQLGDAYSNSVDVIPAGSSSCSLNLKNAAARGGDVVS